MSYICEKPAGSCASCGHYRYDEDYGGMACFAQVDEQMGQKRKGDTAMVTDKERENREELFRLMRENPEPPVVPMVDGEIPGDDSGYWLGAWGGARIDEYLLTSNCERMVFKSDDDVFDVLERHLSDEEFEKLPETEEGCRPFYDALPWTKAIVVYINLPD